MYFVVSLIGYLKQPDLGHLCQGCNPCMLDSNQGPVFISLGPGTENESSFVQFDLTPVGKQCFVYFTIFQYLHYI